MYRLTIAAVLGRMLTDWMTHPSQRRHVPFRYDDRPESFNSLGR